jgi:hypothetical protein
LGILKEGYAKGLRKLLKMIARYIEKESRSVGIKAADSFIAEFPELVTNDMIAFLASTGTDMMLKRDSRAKFVVQVSRCNEIATRTYRVPSLSHPLILFNHNRLFQRLSVF